jgi:hypothetical protein
LEYLFTIERGTNYNNADDPVICISRVICLCFDIVKAIDLKLYTKKISQISMYYVETRADNSGYTNHRVTCLVVIGSSFDSEQVFQISNGYL